MQGKIFDPSAEDLRCVLGIYMKKTQYKGIKDQRLEFQLIRTKIHPP